MNGELKRRKDKFESKVQVEMEAAERDLGQVEPLVNNDNEANFLSSITASESATIKFLQDKGCLRKDVVCGMEGCDQITEVHVYANKTSRFVCPLHKQAWNLVGVRRGSIWSRGFWASHHLSFVETVKLYFSWSKCKTVDETSELLKIDLRIVRRAFIQLRELCQQSLEDDGYSVGGPGCEVHVEVLDHLVEHGTTKKARVLCGYSPRDDLGFASYSSDLSDENICSLTKTYVSPGSTLVSCTLDSSTFSGIQPVLAGFKKISHTHRASKYWTRLKSQRHDRLHGIALKYLNSHMQELMWREFNNLQDPVTTMEVLMAQISMMTNPSHVETFKPARKIKKGEIDHFPLPEDPTEAAKIFSIISSEDEALAYLQEHGCIRKVTTCSVEGCNRPLKKGHNENRTYIRCFSPSHPQKAWSIKKGSFWEGSKINFTTILKILFDWARVATAVDTGEHAKITSVLVRKYFCKFREVCDAWLKNNPYMIGGPGSDIQLEIFDSRVRGRKIIEDKVVLGYSSKDKRGFVRFTKNLSVEYICSLVKKYVVPGSVILSSSWKDCATVQHIEDVDPPYQAGPLSRSKPKLATDYWIKVKKTFGIGITSGAGPCITNFDSYLKEFMWRVVNDTEGPVKTMETMLSHIREQYDLYEDESYGTRPTETEDSLDPWTVDDVPKEEFPDTDIKEAEKSNLLKPVANIPQADLDSVTLRIIDNEGILSNDEILAEDMNLQELSTALKDTKIAMEWCVKHRLLKNIVTCNKCSCPMQLSNKKLVRHVDGYSWCCEQDNARVSIRQGSLFQGSSLSLKEMLIVAYCWTLQHTPNQIAKEARVHEEEVVKMCKLFRSICELWLKKNLSKVGGLDAETGCPVAVDLQMHQISRPRVKSCQRTTWMLSGVDAKTGEYFIVEILNDKPHTVEKAVLDYVQLGSKLVTNGSWPDTDLSALGYIHVKNDDSEMTQDSSDNLNHHHNSLWSNVKHSFELLIHSGASEMPLDSYLHQWLFQNRARAKGQGIFESFIMAIQESYPVASHVENGRLPGLTLQEWLKMPDKEPQEKMTNVLLSTPSIKRKSETPLGPVIGWVTSPNGCRIPLRGPANKVPRYETVSGDEVCASKSSAGARHTLALPRVEGDNSDDKVNDTDASEVDRKGILIGERVIKSIMLVPYVKKKV